MSFHGPSSFTMPTPLHFPIVLAQNGAWQSIAQNLPWSIRTTDAGQRNLSDSWPGPYQARIPGFFDRTWIWPMYVEGISGKRKENETCQDAINGLFRSRFYFCYTLVNMNLEYPLKHNWPGSGPRLLICQQWQELGPLISLQRSDKIPTRHDAAKGGV